MHHWHSGLTKLVELAAGLPVLAFAAFATCAAVDYGSYYLRWATMQSTVTRAAKVGATVASGSFDDEGAPERLALDAAVGSWSARDGQARFVATRNVGFLPQRITVSGRVEFASITGLVPVPSAVTSSAVAVVEAEPHPEPVRRVSFGVPPSPW